MPRPSYGLRKFARQCNLQVMDSSPRRQLSYPDLYYTYLKYTIAINRKRSRSGNVAPRRPNSDAIYLLATFNSQLPGSSLSKNVIENCQHPDELYIPCSTLPFKLIVGGRISTVYNNNMSSYRNYCGVLENANTLIRTR